MTTLASNRLKTLVKEFIARFENPTLFYSLILGTALVPRVLVALLLGDGPRVPDEGGYLSIAESATTGGANLGGYADWFISSYATFIQPVRLVFEITGASIYAGRFVAIIWATLCCLLVGLATRHLVRHELALIASLFFALWPSALLFSSLLLRESTVWFLVCCPFVGLLMFEGPQTRFRRTFAVILVLLPQLLLYWARPQTAVVVTLALSAAVFCSQQNWGWKFSLILLLLVTPAAKDFGVGGSTYIYNSVRNSAQQRITLSKLAESSFSEFDEIGDLNTEQPSVRVPVTRSLEGFLLRPYPTESDSSEDFAVARAEWFLWTPLFGFAPFAMFAVRRRWRTFVYPAVYLVGMVIGAALFQGNLGTAFRHRSQVLWVLIVLGVAGVNEILQRPRPDGTSNQPVEEC